MGIVYFYLPTSGNVPMSRRTVITGGPGTGKTALIRALEQRGHYCFHEIIREMTLNAKQNEEQVLANPLAFVKNPLAFNRMLLSGRIDQFRHAEKLQETSVFYDRGIPDVLAYMDFFGQPYDSEFTRPCRELRYDAVVVLPPWKAIYRQDNERMESFEEACEIHDCLQTTYRAFGYPIESLQPGTIEDRVRQLLEILARNDEQDS